MRIERFQRASQSSAPGLHCSFQSVFDIRCLGVALEWNVDDKEKILRCKNCVSANKLQKNPSLYKV